MPDQFDGSGAVLLRRTRIERQLPSSESAMPWLAAQGGKRSKANLSADPRIFALGLCPRVRPIAHENGTTLLKPSARFLLRRRGDRSRRQAFHQEGTQVSKGFTHFRSFEANAAVAGRTSV